MNFNMYEDKVRRVNQDYKESIEILKSNTLFIYIVYSIYYPVIIVVLNIVYEKIIDVLISVSFWIFFGAAIGFFVIKLFFYIKKQKSLKKIKKELEYHISKIKIENLNRIVMVGPRYIYNVSDDEYKILSANADKYKWCLDTVGEVETTEGKSYVVICDEYIKNIE